MAVALWAAAGVLAPAFAQAPLPVPYLPQTEALCGGAAASMVMRFWGARGVYAEDFSPLVDKDAGGIHTSALDSAVRARGWATVAGGGDLPDLVREVRRGHPVIALIEDRPSRFHYVVVVAASENGPIVVHDPARAPSRAIDLATFERKWQKSDRWMLIMLPRETSASAIAPALKQTPEPSPDTVPGANASTAPLSACQPRIDAAVALVQRGENDAAQRELTQATVDCPNQPAAWRELAGLDVVAKNWSAAATHARRALAIDASDDYTWRLLATAEYLQQDDLAALAAWNHVGEPRVDLVAINGLADTRYLVVADAIGVRPKDVLTPAALRVAQRRVRDIPAVATARVGFHPLERGQAQVDATIVERQRAPLTYASWVGIGAGALANREVTASFANVSGGGDAAEVNWRWWEHRPRIAVGYAAPGPWGIWKLQVLRETQTFGVSRAEETRTRIGGELGNWLTERAWVGGGLFVDRWRDRGRTGAVTLRGEFWPMVDRVAVEGRLSTWRGGDEGFGSADARVRWRSRTAPAGTVLLGAAGYQAATSAAPASLWPGADTGHAREVLLRAHPLLEDGVIEGGVFGRRVAFASVEAQRWLAPKWHGLLRIAPAVFLDTARATHGLATTDQRVHYDLGGGIRLAIPGAGTLRVDLARGLRDGHTALSVGWQR